MWIVTVLWTLQYCSSIFMLRGVALMPRKRLWMSSVKLSTRRHRLATPHITSKLLFLCNGLALSLNKLCVFATREAVETLTATLTITEDMASDGGVLTAARFQWLIGKGMAGLREMFTQLRAAHAATQPPYIYKSQEKQL